MLQQPWQPRNVGGNAPGLVAHERVRRRSSAWDRPRRRSQLFLITQQFSFGAPDLQAVPVYNVVIWTQGFGGLKRRF
jgi:hypothetical protein